MKQKLLLIFALAVVLNSYSQNIWKKEFSDFSFKKIADNPTSYQSLTLNKNYFLEIAKNAPKRSENKTSFSEISLPVNANEFEIFKIVQTSNFNVKLSERYPSIRSYIAKSLHSNKTARLSYSSYSGLSVTIYTNNETLIIKPSDVKNNNYVFYSNKDNQIISDFECNTIEKAKKSLQTKNNLNNFENDGYLRKYRLALATTGEYSNFFLTGSESTDEERKATVLAAINNSLTRINGIFERDFGVTMELIDNNDDLIFLDGSSDPFNSSYNTELQNTLDTTIGSDNYDVGHLFLYEGSIYGNAGCIACVCTDGSKGSAFTAHSQPDSDHFNMIASHEFGHQFGGYHVQSSTNCRSSVELQEVEPGSGSSIMSYAGICSPNVQQNPDDYFNYVDIRDVIEWTRNNSFCAELISTGNNDPVADAGNDYSIPISTPFILTGNATDDNSDDALTYCWEQNDPENPFSSDFPQSTWEQGPLFRSKLPVDTPVRYIPQLEDVIIGNLTPTWEVLPSVERDLDFAFTVRDNALVGPKTDADLMTISVIDNGGAFYVTSQNDNESWNAGESKTISWNVAGTDQTPINVSNVDILLSTDGGYTYPYTIIANTPNTGNVDIVVPTITESTDEARIMVKPVNNIFYAINASNISIQVSEFSMTFDENSLDVCKPNTVSYTFIYQTYLGFDDETEFSVENLPDNLTANFSPESVTNNNTEVTLTINDIDTADIGEINFNVLGSSNNIERRNILTLNVYEQVIDSPILAIPNDNATTVNTLTNFEWNIDENINNYIFEIATDSNFTNIIETASIIESQYSIVNSLDYNTTYYWRVSGENSCNNSSFSNTFSFTTTCFAPDNISSINASTNSIDITWVDTSNTSSWEIEIVESGQTPTGNGTIVFENPYTVTNLNTNTNYSVYLRGICSNTNFSEWVGPFNFKTLSDFCNGDKFYDSGGLNGDYSNNEYIETTIAPITGDFVIITFDSFDLETDWDYLTIYDGNNTNATLIGIYTGTNSPGTITSKFGQGITFVFTSDNSVVRSGWEASVECLTITCPEPSDVNYSNLTSNSVDLSWTPNGDETNWIIEYGETGFIPGTGEEISTNTTIYSLDNLSLNTTYDVYVKADCGDETSSYSSVTTFTTLCDTVAAPFYENFSSNSTPECWQEYGSENWNFNTSAAFDAENAGDHTQTRNTNYAWIDGSAPNGANQISNLKTVPIDISTLNNPEVEFAIFSKNTNDNYYNTLTVNLHDGTNTINLLTLQRETQNGWELFNFNLSSYNLNSNIVEIEFVVTENSIGTPYYNDILIDDIKIDEIPSCPEPSNLSATNITTNSIDLLWSSNGSETSWILEYGEVGFTPGSEIATEVSADTNSYTLNNLNSNTSYDIYVKVNCNDGTYVYSPVATFTTIADYCGGDNFHYIDDNIENFYSTTIYPSDFNNQLTVSFNSLYIGQDDYLIIHDGEDDSSEPIEVFTNTSEIPEDIISNSSNNNTSGALTFVFYSFNTNISSEWDATITCDLISCFKPENLSANNTTITTTELTWNTINNESNWIIEYGETGFTLGAGTEVSVTTNPYILENLNSNTTYDVYVKANCGDETSTYSSVTTFTTVADYCNGDHFYDTGGVNGDYNVDEYYTTTIYPSEGFDQITAVFNSFDVESGFDFLTIYDGENLNAPIIGQYTGTNNPGTIIANNSAGALTFEFVSDQIIPSSGWDATIICSLNTCPKPSELIVTNQTSNSTDLSWTSNGDETNWILEYGEPDFEPGTGTEILTSTNPYTLDNLSSNTTYDVYVKANCGDEMSNFSEVITFTTIPDYCNGDSFYYENTTDEVYTHTIHPSEDNNQISVSFNGIYINDNHQLTIYNGENNLAPILAVFTDFNDLTDEIADEYTSNNDTGALTFVFIPNGPSTYSSEWDATITCQSINCFAPLNLSSTNITSNTTDLSWTSNGNESNWILEYGNSGFIPGNGTEVSVTTNPYTLDDLSPNTTYDVYVKADCGDETSGYSLATTFSTECEIISAPFYENFSSSTTPLCWQESGSENWIYNTNADYDALDAGDFTSSGNTNYAWIDGSTPNGANQISHLKTNFIDISNLDSPQLEFAVFSQNTISSFFNNLTVILSDNAGNTTTLLNLQGATNNGWEIFSYNLNDYTINDNIIQIEFIIAENSPLNPYHNDILIDEIKVENSDDVLNTSNNTITNFSYYPNPVNNVLNITSGEEISKIEVYDLLGQKLMYKKPNTQNLIQQQVDLSKLSTGTYLIKVFADDKFKQFKVIKK